MNAITFLLDRGHREITGWRRNQTKVRGWKKRRWCTRTELRGKTIFEKKRERRKSAHPATTSTLLTLFFILPSHLCSWTPGLAEQFPLDIDYCCNCTMLITWLLGSSLLRLFLSSLFTLHFLFLSSSWAALDLWTAFFFFYYLIKYIH